MVKIKSFVFSLCLAALLITGSIFYNLKLEKASSGLLLTLNKITQSLENENFTSAHKQTLLLEKNVKNLEIYFASLGNHQEIDNIEMTLAEMKSYIKDNQRHDALAKAQVLNFLFYHLPKNSRLKPENIF